MEGWSYTLFTLVFISAVTHTDMALQEGPKKLLDMSPSAVDDQFLSCRDRMLQSLMGRGGLLERELSNSDGFRRAWQNKTCGGPIQRGKLEHTKALETYVTDSKFRYKFNNAVESQGSSASVYRSSFPYKSLHFLLTDAIHLLKEKTCRTLFRGSDTLYSTTKGSQVRFGRFASALESKSEAEEDFRTSGTLFNITSCAAAHIESYICEHHSVSWIIPPYEVFEVVDVKETDEYREITLMHKKLFSNHNCSFFTDAPSSFAPPMAPGSLLLFAAALSVGLGVGLQRLSC
ncbi:ecto-ADP-ribosyltransferase 4-like isoform X2 [Scleropages formosus]|uniref:ecto-ADP-ribosyltransferase 4-like isoform X2 n=1 Tax=Scleropages formosus TaxID=113540 RepID=UPI0010FAC6D4|nr:ecto-ADP-ribosyltransferase 4-like isoform X2 [Scleropages formosus]